MRPFGRFRVRVAPDLACHTVAVQITKTTTADGFVAVDLPEAATATGVVRCARKILQDGAVNLARSLTYSYAAFGIPTSGASAGINAEGDARDAAVAAFVEELTPRIAEGLTLTAGKGVRADELAAWSAASSADPAAGSDIDALAAGVIAAVSAAIELGDTTVGVEAGAPGADAIAAAANEAGAEASIAPIADLLADPRMVTIVGSKPGVLDHVNVSGVTRGVIAGAAGLTITARGLAVARRNGVVVLPDFVTAAGPVLAAAGISDSATRIGEVVRSVLDHAEGPYLGACLAAEASLRTWVTDMPFGRPMA